MANEHAVYVMFIFTEDLSKIELIQRLATDTPVEGAYLKSFDPDAFDGRGHVVFEPDKHKAQLFNSLEAVFAEWHRESTVRPLRSDGKPNKPLTAFHIEPQLLEIKGQS